MTFSQEVGPLWVPSNLQSIPCTILVVGDAIQVYKLISQCVIYDQVHASFNTLTPQLQPLPIIGFNYQWNWDFVNPLRLTIMFGLLSSIFSSVQSWCYCIIVVISQKLCTHPLIGCIIGLAFQPKYSLAKVWNFIRNFKSCYVRKILINYQTTSQDHLEADGLVEQMV